MLHKFRRRQDAIQLPLSKNLLDCVGQVGPIVIFVLAFVMLAVYWIILSPLVDQVIDIHNAQTPAIGLVQTQERADAIHILQLAFAAFVVFVPIVLFLWLILQSLRHREGMVY